MFIPFTVCDVKEPVSAAAHNPRHKPVFVTAFMSEAFPTTLAPSTVASCNGIPEACEASSTVMAPSCTA